MATQILLLGVVFTVLAMVTDSAFVVLSGALGAWLRASRSARRGIARLGAGVYLGLGLSAALPGTGRGSTG